ncbi:MAG: hypothetical protein ACK5KM_11630 [Hyphomicrobiaceae bacterium]
MRLVGSVLVLISALSVGAYAYLPPIYPGQDRLAEILLIQASDHATADERDAGMQPLARHDEAHALIGSQHPEARPGPAALAPAPKSGAVPGNGGVLSTIKRADAKVITPPVAIARPWRTIVTGANTNAAPVLNSATPAKHDYEARYRLIRDLQAELKRVGCYAGNIDGDWGPGSRYAASSFLRKVNATLPIRNPDYILLSLVRGHPDRACGINCPSGQTLGSDGRCIASVIAQRTNSPPPSKPGLRVHDALPASDKPARETRIVGAQGDDTIVAPTPRLARRPDVAKVDQQLAQPPPASTTQRWGTADSRAVMPRREPLPGRMSIGAPLPANAPPTLPVIAAPPTPEKAPPQLVRLQQQARLTNESDRFGAVRSNGQRAREGQAAKRHPAKSTGLNRAKVPTTSQMRSIKKASRSHKRARRSRMVTTSAGKVRRGSTRHNLMLSLGGVF